METSRLMIDWGLGSLMSNTQTILKNIIEYTQKKAKKNNERNND